jgi:regulator of nonsense transcripts 2
LKFNNVKDIGKELIKNLIEEFNVSYKKKDQTKIESKIKNIRFLGELTKFRLINNEIILDFILQLLNDFTHHNIDVLCNLFETCGRYLLYSIETNEKIKTYLDMMMKLKDIKMLDTKYNIIIENAYFTSIGVEFNKKEENVIKKTDIQRYIEYLIYTDTNMDTKFVLKKLLKLNWKVNIL